MTRIDLGLFSGQQKRLDSMRTHRPSVCIGDPAKRAQVAALVEGNSIRSTIRMTGVAKNTVTKRLVDLGRACDEYQRKTLVDLRCKPDPVRWNLIRRLRQGQERPRANDG
jgi:hypothetical protein